MAVVALSANKSVCVCQTTRRAVTETSARGCSFFMAVTGQSLSAGEGGAGAAEGVGGVYISRRGSA